MPNELLIFVPLSAVLLSFAHSILYVLLRLRKTSKLYQDVSLLSIDALKANQKEKEGENKEKSKLETALEIKSYTLLIERLGFWSVIRRPLSFSLLCGVIFLIMEAFRYGWFENIEHFTSLALFFNPTATRIKIHDKIKKATVKKVCFV